MTTDKGQRWLPFAFLGGVAVVWATALAGPFQFDDYNVIAHYAPVHSLTAWWDAMPGIRPLLKLSYALNWTLSPSPFGFHLFNLLVHLLNGALLLGWARRVLPLSPLAAQAFVALWLLHPVQTEAVTYIAGRSVSLSTTFLLAGLLVLAHRSRGAPVWAALCTLFALLVRETAWVFPLAFALVEFLRGADRRALLHRVAPSAAVVVLAACAFLIEPHYRQMIDTSFALRGIGAQWRLQAAAHAYLLSQWVVLVPNIDPDVRALSAGPATLAAMAMAGTAGAALLVTVRRRSWAAAGVLWYLLLLLPTNSLMPRVDAASDRHLYAALAGPLWSLSVMLQGWRYRVPAIVAALLLLALATLTRNNDYRSELALWARTALQSPEKARVWNNLGIACREAGEPRCAAEAFERAVSLDPSDPRAGVNLYFLRKQETAAEAQ